MNSHEMERYCQPLIAKLWDSDPAEADSLITTAARIVEEAAAGSWDRDNIRTEPFTKKVIAACGAAPD